MCIPVDSMLWALVTRIRDDGYVAREADLRALLGSGCTAVRAREVLSAEAARCPDKPFSAALALLARIA